MQVNIDTRPSDACIRAGFVVLIMQKKIEENVNLMAEFKFSNDDDDCPQLSCPLEGGCSGEEKTGCQKMGGQNGTPTSGADVLL